MTRVAFNRLPEVLDRLSKAILGSFVPEEAALRVCDLRFQTGCSHLGKPRLFTGLKFHPDLIDDRPCHLILQREDISNMALVGLPPYALLAVWLDQLHVD